MTGYNRYPWCPCGWCIGGGGDSKRAIKLFDSFPSYSSSRSNASSIAQTKGAQTYQTLCWWCKEPVYYYTNGYGDHVLFDSLGYPWQIHKCWSEYWQQQKDRNTRKLRIRSNLLFQKPNKEIPAFCSFDEVQQKHLILVGIFSQLNDDEVATEENIANKMGLELEVFRKEYSYHYTLYRNNGVAQMRLEEAPWYVTDENISNDRIIMKKSNRRIKITPKKFTKP